MNAQDIEPPKININETVQAGNSRINLEAIDTGTGVRKIMYSLDGTAYQQYTAPLTLNAATTPIIYVFADDNVFNRSGLVTHNLTASNAGFSVTGPSSAPTGVLATARWNATVGRPINDWIGLFRVGALNSAFISKQYTGGLTSGSLNFVLPFQPGAYEFRYSVNDSFSSVATSSPINVFLDTTAASATVSGRVMKPSGGGVPRAVVQITDQFGTIRTTRTNPFGYYRFEDIRVGQTLVVSVSSKSYQFTSQVIDLEDMISDLNFIALVPDEPRHLE